MATHSSKTHAGLERVPGKQNWVDYAGGLPDYIERIAKHIHADSGYTISHAIASAVNRVKKLILKGSPATKAKATKALAQWEAKKARGKKNLTDAELIEEVVINMAEAPEKKAGSKSAGVTDPKKLAAAIAQFRKNKAAGKYSAEQAAKIEARLKSSQQRLGKKVGLSEQVDLSQHDLVFYENRRTPEVVAKGAEPKKSGGKAGKVKSRRPATAEEEKKIAKGDWVRVDSGGKKPSDDGYISGSKSMGPDANRKKKNLSEEVDLFTRNMHRFDLSEKETITKYLEGRAAKEGVTINLSAAPEGTIIARQTRFNPTKHNRGFGGRFAPKVQ